jgi:hypothetical protein
LFGGGLNPFPAALNGVPQGSPNQIGKRSISRRVD